MKSNGIDTVSIRIRFCTMIVKAFKSTFSFEPDSLRNTKHFSFHFLGDHVSDARDTYCYSIILSYQFEREASYIVL